MIDVAQGHKTIRIESKRLIPPPSGALIGTRQRNGWDATSGPDGYQICPAMGRFKVQFDVAVDRQSSGLQVGNNNTITLQCDHNGIVSTRCHPATPKQHQNNTHRKQQHRRAPDTETQPTPSRHPPRWPTHARVQARFHSHTPCGSMHAVDHIDYIDYIDLAAMHAPTAT